MVRPDDLPNFSSSDPPEADTFARDVITKHINIDDDPTEDILCHLRDACDFIDGGLLSRSKDEDASKQVGVLVHCTQGISRSASFVIAYCTYVPRKLHRRFIHSLLIKFVPALTTAFLHSS